MSQPHYPRLMELRVNQAMKDTPIVLLSGPRQAGKTTIARQMALDKGLEYITIDDAIAL